MLSSLLASSSGISPCFDVLAVRFIRQEKNSKLFGYAGVRAARKSLLEDITCGVVLARRVLLTVIVGLLNVALAGKRGFLANINLGKACVIVAMEKIQNISLIVIEA